MSGTGVGCQQVNALLGGRFAHSVLAPAFF
jgi:hypothetical protein